MPVYVTGFPVGSCRDGKWPNQVDPNIVSGSPAKIVDNLRYQSSTQYSQFLLFYNNCLKFKQTGICSTQAELKKKSLNLF